MKRILFTLSLLCLIYNSRAQQTLSAADSDPKKMGWMRGFPPAPDRVLSSEFGSFFQFPALRYSVCHMRQFFPTTEVNSGDQHYQFTSTPDPNIDTLSFTPWNSKQKMTWRASLAANYTDGILVLHRGRIVYEQYFAELTRSGVHAVMSVSKSVTALLACMLIADGQLNPGRTAASYLPELRGSGFGDATIRQILDMTTSIQFNEEYTDPKADIWTFSAIGNPFLRQKDSKLPQNYFDYIKTVPKTGPHGKAFAYKTVNADALGWIVSRVSGKSIPDLLSERIWTPMGAQKEAYYQVDGAGIAFAGGGLNCTLRDAGMLAEMIRCNGYFNGKQILKKEVTLGIAEARQQNTTLKIKEKVRNWSYRNMWWMTNNTNGAFAALGIHGQIIYIDPAAEMVIVRFASHPSGSNTANDATSIPAYEALASYLSKK